MIRKVISATLALCIFMAPLAIADHPTQPVVQKTFYVSPSGSDENDGSKESPFATIQRAQQAVRSINANMTGDIVVYLAGGIYDVKETINFNHLDSGSNGFRVIYKALEDQEPILDGGKKVSQWSQVEGSNLWKAHVDSPDYIRNIFVNGHRAQIAASARSYTGISEYKDDKGVLSGFYVDDSVIGNYENQSDIQLHWVASWKTHILPVEKIVDEGDGKKLILMQQPYYKNSFPGNIVKNGWNPYYDHEFFVQNAFELLDEPGEWYYNRVTRELFYYPLANEHMETAEVYVPVTDKLLDVRGTLENPVKNLTFSGITFRHTAWEQPSVKGYVTLQAEVLINTALNFGARIMVPGGIEIDNAKDFHFTNNRLMRFGQIALLLKDGIERAVVEGNYFYDNSHAAIVLGHFFTHAGDLDKISKNTSIRNNLIRKSGQEFWGAPAISTYYAQDLEISHNDIADIPYIGISVGWGWGKNNATTPSKNIMVKNNRIVRSFMKMEDGGAIYTMSAHPGSVVSGNYIKSAHFNAIQNDKGTSGITFKNNVMEDIDIRWRQFSREVTHCIYDNNFTNTKIEASGSGSTDNKITNTHFVADAKWPEAARKIIDNAGLKSEFKSLLSLIPSDYTYTLLDENYHIPDYIYKWELKAALDSKFGAKLAKDTTVAFKHAPAPDTECGLITDNSTSGKAVTTNKFDAYSGKMSVKWRFKMDAVKPYHFKLMSEDAEAIVLKISDSVLSAADKNGRLTALQTLEDGKWYMVELIINPESGKYDVYIDQSLKASALEFTNSAQSLNAFSTSSNDSGTSVLYIDDLKVTANPRLQY